MLTKPDITIEAAMLRWFLARVRYRLRAKLGARNAQWRDMDDHFARTVADGYLNKHSQTNESVAEEKPLPIVFIHYGDNNYLRYSLEQAQHSNPYSPIYLIGDEQNNRYSFVKHYCYLD